MGSRHTQQDDVPDGRGSGVKGRANERRDPSGLSALKRGGERDWIVISIEQDEGVHAGTTGIEQVMLAPRARVDVRDGHEPGETSLELAEGVQRHWAAVEEVEDREVDRLFLTPKGQLSPVGAGINGMAPTQRGPDSKETGGMGKERGDDTHERR